MRRVLVLCLLVACGSKKQRATGESEADQLARKEYAYVVCLNATDADTCLPEYIGECRNGIAKASQLPPSLPALEKAGAEYAATIQKLAPLCADRKAVPPELIAARDKLTREVDAVEDRLQQADLVEIEKTEGRTLHWYHLQLLIAAKQAARVPSAEKADALEAAIGEVGKQEHRPRGYKAVEYQARQLVEAVRAGDHDAMVRAYNALVDASNRVAL